MKHGKHGRSRTPEFWAWVNMLRRCHYPKHPNFASYGGRGITVCAEWRSSFAAFYSHIGPRPNAKHSIERIDNQAGYEPGNVKWATRAEQMRNTRANHWIEIDGQVKTVSDWAKACGIHFTTVHHRIARGMSERDAVLAPPRFGGRRASRR